MPTDHPPHDENRWPHPAGDVAFVRVEHPSGPDRCTIYPRAADGLRLMETWLSADDAAFVDLAMMR